MIDTTRLAIKNDIVPTNGTLTRIFDKSKIDVANIDVSITEVDKIEVSRIGVLTTEITVEGYNLVVEGGCSSVNEVVATYAMVTLS